MSFKSYRDDSSQWGNYQYVPLDQIVNDFMANRDPDDYVSNVSRHRVLYNSMRGIRELYYDVLQEIRAIEVNVGTSLNAMLPPDYVNYVRISYIDDDGYLRPMTHNNKSNIANKYLLDSQDRILVDKNGCVVTGTATRPTPQDSSDREEYRQLIFEQGYTPNINLADYHKNGSFKINKSDGYIQFDSNIKSSKIVIEYISDGLFTDTCGGGEEDIRIHKFAEQALIDWIYWNLVKQRRSVPANEKKRARDEYYNSRRIAGRRINTIRKEELIQAMSGSTMNIEPSN